MKVYEHYVDEKNYVAEQHDRLLEKMKKDTGGVFKSAKIS